MERLSLSIWVMFSSIVFSYSKDPSVVTSLGEIIGKTTTLPSDALPYKDVHQYFGIPFAEPPVGERRFLKPEAILKLTSPFYAQTPGAVCPQIPTSFNATSVNMSEDCLFLNVFVPNQTADKPSGRAVMVWIHGGAFLEGAGSQYDGSYIAAAGNVIVVTINYRLGVFGFLSTGDYNAPGNVGLWDQRMALQWVRDHISRFGGDKDRVTIAGESAGAMSAIQHGLTDKNHGLFKRIIAQSGSMSMPVQELERDALNDAKITANSLGCDTDVTITTLMYCLRSKSVNDYLSAIKEFGYIVYFSPIVDGDFVEINPKHIARMSERQSLEEVEFFRSIDILSGFNAYEGVLFLPFVIPPDKLEALKPTRENMTLNYIPSMLNYLYKMDFKTEVTNLVAAQYTNWKDPSDSNSIRLQITKLLGDVSYGTPAIEMARLHKKSNVSRNFMYHFTPTPSRRWIPTPSWIPGATHSDELLFMFGGIGYIGVGEQNAWEIDLVNKMVTYWTNFIKSGDPNIPVSVTPRWPEYNLESGDYLKLEKFMSNSSAGRLFYAEEAKFWLDVFPALIEAVHKDGSDCDDPVYTSAAAEDPVYWIQSLIMAMLLLQLIRP